MISLGTLDLVRQIRPPTDSSDGHITHNVCTVTSISLASSPPTIVLTDGFGVTYSNAVWPANAYTPVVGDVVVVFHSGQLTIVHGTVPKA